MDDGSVFWVGRGKPVWASVALPTQRMNPTNQATAVASIPIGDAVVVSAALANGGARRLGRAKAKLRSQNMAFALLAMPACIISFADAGIGDLKARAGGIHRQALS